MKVADDLQAFLGSDLPVPVLKLAVEKCRLSVEDAIDMLINEEKLADLMDEVSRREEELSPPIVIAEKQDSIQDIEEETKLNLIISNKSEYFELLFELLNLDINDITNAAWALLVQVPVNKKLMTSIKELEVHPGETTPRWDEIIETNSMYRMLY